MKGVFLLSLALGLLLAGALWVSVYIWTSLDGGDVAFRISWHGWLAMGLGVTLTAVLGVGLMALVFHSSRSGHDDLDDET